MKPLKRSIAILILVFVFCAWTFIAIPTGLLILAIEQRAYGTAPAAPQFSTGQTAPLWVCRFHGPCKIAYVTASTARTDKIANIIFKSWLAASVIWIAIMIPIGIRAKRVKAHKT